MIEVPYRMYNSHLSQLFFLYLLLLWRRLVTAENKLLIVKLGGLEPLIRQMLSPNVEVQCNAVGCITNLATHGKTTYCHFPIVSQYYVLCIMKRDEIISLD
jgi:vacuolar protein 8